MLHRQLTRPRAIYLASFVMALGVIALIIGAPWFARHGYPVTAAVIYQAFSPLCHQIPSRSFHFDGVPLAVCARCTGVYFGLIPGLMVYPLWRRVDSERMPHRAWLTAGIAPMAIDCVAGVVGMFSSPIAFRTATGILAGMAIASFILPGLVSIALTPSEDRRSRKSTAEASNTVVSG